MITIDSPHAGADLAESSASFLLGVSGLYNAGLAIWSASTIGALSFSSVFATTGVVRTIMAGNAVVLQEMKPSSAFLSQLKTRPEAGYKRFAIRSQVSQDWTSVRVYCDRQPPTLPGIPRGLACVGDVSRLVQRATFNGALLGFLSVIAQFIPVVGPGIGQSLQYASRAFFVLTGLMYSVDWKWREVFCGNQACDGVVRLTSQVYPNTNAECGFRLMSITHFG